MDIDLFSSIANAALIATGSKYEAIPDHLPLSLTAFLSENIATTSFTGPGKQESVVLPSS
jgi:hypothetical protein